MPASHFDVNPMTGRPKFMKVLDFLANEGPLSQPFGGIYCAEILFT
jgi:hypothetical protein